MRKIFAWLGHWLLKYKKRLIYGLFALFIGQICFFGIKGIGIENQVLAANGQTEATKTAEDKLKEWEESLAFINKIIYALIYPMLVLAGKLVDNSLVYGEVFGFDAVLWKLWNIVKNLANFTLGFIFLFKIFKYLIDGKEKVKDIILKSLIAGIGIQASRFIMATLIDASTILAYGVGGLPITTLKGSSIEDQRLQYNPYVLKKVVSMDSKTNLFDVYLTNIGGTGDNEKEGKFYISECWTFKYGSTGHSEELILAPKNIYYRLYQSGSDVFMPTDGNRCHYYGQVYYFENLAPSIENDREGNFPGIGSDGKFNKCADEKNCEDGQGKYGALLKTVGDNYASTGKIEVESLIAGAAILEIGDAHTEGGIFGSVFTDVPVYKPEEHRGLDVDNKWTGEGDKTTRLQGILGGDSYVGVFTALYSSLMERGRNVIPDASGSGLFVEVINTVLSVGFLFAIGIPLIVVAVVFMMRIGILWMAISLSPFIVLLTAFDLFKSKLGKIEFLEYFKIENLIPIIFSPAVICFAVSLSTVLVTIIQNMNVDIDKIQGSSTILGGLVEVSFAGFPIKIAEIINLLLGVAVTWFILWAAIETSKLGESKFIQSLKNLTNSALGSMPIIPVPGKDGNVEYMGAGTVFGLNGQDGIISRMGQKLKSQYEAKDQKTLEELINPEEAKKTAQGKAKKNRLTEYINGLGNATIGDNWMSDYTIKETDVLGSDATNFNTLGAAQQEEVIKEINDLSLEQRVKFGTATPTIEISGDNIRDFKETDENNRPLKKFVKREIEPEKK